MEGVFRLTGCQKPCFYKKYKFVGDKVTTSFPSEHFTFSLWAVSNNTMVEVEQLVYPQMSLIAELCGTLGIFLGFSFLTVWDGLCYVLLLGQNVCGKWID